MNPGNCGKSFVSDAGAKLVDSREEFDSSDVGHSHLRKKTITLLGDVDRKYAGKRTSRKKLVQDDDNSEEGTIKQTVKLTICIRAQRLSGRVLDSRQRGSVFKPHQCNGQFFPRGKI